MTFFFTYLNTVIDRFWNKNAVRSFKRSIQAVKYTEVLKELKDYCPLTEPGLPLLFYPSSGGAWVGFCRTAAARLP